MDLFIDHHAAEQLVENTQGMYDNSDPVSDGGFASGRNESREMNGARWPWDANFECTEAPDS